MKKFLFIIPKVNLFFFLILFVLTIAQLKSIAADGIDGCHIVTGGGQERNYHTPFTLGVGSPTEWISTSVGGAGYNLNTSSRCIETIGAFCTVYKYGAGANPTASDVLYTGYYAIMIDCPVDDYIPVLIIFTIGIVVSRYKKQQ